MAIPMAVGSVVDVQLVKPDGSQTGDSGTVVAMTANYFEITSSQSNGDDKVYPWHSIFSVWVIS